VSKKHLQDSHKTCTERIEALESRVSTLEKLVEKLAPRTNAEKRRIVEAALRDSERHHLSDREIARQCGVAHAFVLKIREELGLQRDPNTPRFVTRGGTTYPMRVAGITARTK
jgi:hypothetical protein